MLVCVLVFSVFQGFSQPMSPVLDSVTVNAAGRFQLTWEPSVSANVTGYIINFYEFSLGSWRGIPIDTVWGNITTWVADDSIDEGGKGVKFIVQALDNNMIASSLTNYQQNTYLSSVSADICAQAIQVSWEAYINLPGDVKSYRIYSSKDGATYTLLGEVSSTTLSYTMSSPVSGSNYCFYIQTVSTSGITTTSNTRCVTYTKAPAPTYVYIRSATAKGQFVNLLFTRDAAGYAKKQIIQRSSDGITYNDIDTIAATASTYIDSTSFPDKQTYYYKISIIDECDMISAVSATAQTLFLIGSALEGFNNQLQWSFYQGFAAGGDIYDVYRIMPDGREELVYTFSGNSYTDDVSSIEEVTDGYKYYIRVTENATNSYGFRDESYSNIVLVTPSPSIYIPNAFNPEGVTTTFGPIGKFLSNDGYKFIIFSRWGMAVFESSDVYTLWDGNFEGRAMPAGVYNYLLQYSDNKGMKQTMRGSVLLFR